jgi:hypothetical protein
MKAGASRDERKRRMPRAPKRTRRRRRQMRLRTSGPTFPVRVVREPIDRVEEESPSDRNGAAAERTDSSRNRLDRTRRSERHGDRNAYLDAITDRWLRQHDKKP